MKRIFIAVILFAGVTIQSNSQNYPVIAKESCDCFKKLKDTMEPEFRELIIRVVKEKDIKTAFSKATDSLSDAKKEKFFNQFGTIGSHMDSEETEEGRCALSIAEKYDYEKYKSNPSLSKEFTTRLSEEMRKNKNCELLAAIFLYALAMSE